MKKTTLQWKPMELGGVPIKKRWIFPLRLIFYVCSSARNLVSSMYKGIDQFPLGSSDPGCLKFLNWHIKKHQVTRNDKFIFVLWKEMSFSSSPKVTPTTGVVEQWKKTILQWKPMELGCIPQKMDEPSLGFHGLSRLVSKNIVSDVPRND